MTTRIALTALVGRTGAVLLRMRDEQSAVRANRWSLPGGAVRPAETPLHAAKRHIAEQTGLPVDAEPVEFWHGYLPGTRVDVYCFAAPTSAWTPDIVPQAGVVAEFVHGEEVLSGRAFTPASGFVLGRFLDSNEYLRMAGRFYPVDPT
ncbi:NUDIX domain-containing protein [Catellatospora tritici]|uniref:NUDIX domain-containing protein n=1 Tax=Catellatospora tritici TaxID=2851566 RepID=UPI001C2D8382|nr:NUDIX domain-containing protein [Catellatospora tritici]MBV1850840.1 NUDIX domain-containing protein [Catellatospora tritici]MBV1851093.1 NUDIX domain-containing protein [Catellatospora tritici]